MVIDQLVSKSNLCIHRRLRRLYLANSKSVRPTYEKVALYKTQLCKYWISSNKIAIWLEVQRNSKVSRKVCKLPQKRWIVVIREIKRISWMISAHPSPFKKHLVRGPDSGIMWRHRQMSRLTRRLMEIRLTWGRVPPRLMLNRSGSTQPLPSLDKITFPTLFCKISS